MSRLPGYDYAKPYYYMVTLKKIRGLPAFSEIVDDESSHYLAGNAITRLFVDIIKTFHEKWACIEPITCFSVMPDHIHLLIKIKAVEKRKSLPVIVWQLAKSLEGAYFSVLPDAAGKGQTPTDAALAGKVEPLIDAAGKGQTPTDAALAGKVAPLTAMKQLSCAGKRSAGGDCGRPHCFEPDWHDWIVKRHDQLAIFTRYIRENPYRALLRRKNAAYFGKVTRVRFLDREWFAYGNCALLDLPVLKAFKGHRATIEDSEPWHALVAEASRIGPGGAGVSTFMSPLEKACGNAIAKAGGKLIVLFPEGFSERWHPTREKERYCANGRMLFLSPYEASAKKPTKAELYDRSHEMVDWVSDKLPSHVG